MGARSGPEIRQTLFGAPAAAWGRVTRRGAGVLAPELDVEDPGVATRSIVVASSERTGSTLVTEALWATGVAGAPDEYLNPVILGEAYERFGVPRPRWRSRVRRQLRRARLHLDWVATWNLEPESIEPYLDIVLSRRTSANGVFATKLHWQHLVSMREAGVSVGLLPQPITWVYVSRRDHLAQAVSLVRARQTGLWRSDHVVPRVRSSGPVYDGPAIAAALAQVRQWSEGWERYFVDEGIEPVRVVYEELTADYAGTLRWVFRSIGVDAEPDPTPSMQRQRDEISEEWMRRFRVEPVDAPPSLR